MNKDELKVGYSYTDGESIGVFTNRSFVSPNGTIVMLATHYEDSILQYEPFPIIILKPVMD